MANYTYGWVLEDRGYKEVSKENYTEYQIDMENYIKSLSKVINEAKCGWTAVEYKVMKHREYGIIEEYMRLYVVGGGDRWIPITSNSKGANFQVLGENIW